MRPYLSHLPLLFVLACGGDKDPDTEPTDSAEPEDTGEEDTGEEDTGEEDTGEAQADCDPGYVLEDGDCVYACDDLTAHYSPLANPGAPPYGGTVWFSADILTPNDPTAFVGLTYMGTGQRTMYDRRSASWVQLNAHLFDARFGSTVTVEVQVNPEFSAQDAELEALRYSEAIGRIPAFFFTDLQTVWIHQGVEGFGGGNNNLLIHTGRGEEYINDGVLEEVFLHEGAHTSLDATHAADPMWIAAQQADGAAISEYASDNLTREDVAETIGPYLALRHATARVDAALLATVQDTVPNRVLYLDCLALTMELVP